MSSKVEVAVRSDMGCVRKNNEDNFGYDPANGIYVVCDGMGGVAAGEVASAIACSTAISTYAAQPEETPVHTRLALSIHSANSAVRHAALDDNQHGMGTTLVCAAIQGNKLLVGNVGDSRAYLFQNGATMQLTVDHSYINELVRQGAVRVEDIHTVNLKGMESVITRAIGASNDVEPDFFALDLKPSDTLLLASDGLTRYVDSGLLVTLVDPTDLESSCERLIDAAKNAGGADNITCLLLRYDEVAEAAMEAPAAQAPFAAPVEAALVEAAPFAAAVEATPEPVWEPVNAEAPVEEATGTEAPSVPAHVLEDLDFEAPLNAFASEPVAATEPAPIKFAPVFAPVEAVEEDLHPFEASFEAPAAPAAEAITEEQPPTLPVAWPTEPETPEHAEVPKHTEPAVSFDDLLAHEAAPAEAVADEPHPSEAPVETPVEAAPAPIETVAKEPTPTLPLAWLAEQQAPKNSGATVSFEDLLADESKK